MRLWEVSILQLDVHAGQETSFLHFKDFKVLEDGGLVELRILVVLSSHALVLYNLNLGACLTDWLASGLLAH